ncbi:MAG TPA: hypothetical protein PL033_19095 [Candidatus Brocadiia bacterium]|nr:hypothetical protein [Candidatus Brocadiia bacterium]
MNIPDLTQTDREGDFPGGGATLCGPVSVSNSLMWLSNRPGYARLCPDAASPKDSQIRMVKLLCEQRHMDANVKSGTGPSGIIQGVKSYLSESGCGWKRLECQGWRKHPREYGTGVEKPQLDWLRQGIADDGCVWLNVGWYKRDVAADAYERIGGHWVTMVGYGADENGRDAPDILILHDPAPRCGKEFANEFALPVLIESGRLTGKETGLPRDAAGYYKLSGGMHVKSGADCAVIDAAVILEPR